MKILSDIHRSLWKVKVTFQEASRRYKYRRELDDNLAFQDKYIDKKRCFVVCNGPSLNEEDLNIIESHSEVTFASNRIFKMFPDTKWRPTYYGVCDTSLFRKSKEEIDNVDSIKFIPLDIYDNYVENKDRYHVFSRVPFTYFNRPPKFSNKLTKRFGEGGTITYHLIQMAVSMGFKEIYLIGCDFSFSFGIGADGKYFEDKSIKFNHHKRDTTPIDTMPNLKVNLQAYLAAEKYARKHGINIYNATRGGKLEVFERKDFDSLFK